MRKIHCLNAISKVGLDRLSKEYTLTDNAAEADGILVRSANMHEMEFSDNLEAIARAGAGVNNIPLDKCTEKGIVVFNTPGANANGVKELVIAAMLLASRDIVGGINWVKDNKDDENIAKDMEKAKKAFAGNEILTKRMGVIGLGAIGLRVANAAVDLGMKVYGYDPYISVNAAWQLSPVVKHVADVQEIFEKCDYISVHVPALPSTIGMINKETLGIMKDGVVILNYARDILVNDDDMLEALKSGKVKRYMTDFPNPKVTHMPGVIATPHLGASTAESEDNCAVMAVNQMTNYLETGSIKNSVNYPNCELPPCRGKARICIFNKNIPNMIGSFATVLASEGINIPDMVNKSKGEVAYTLMDADQDVPQSCIDKLMKIEGVYKVRVIKGVQ